MYALLLTVLCCSLLGADSLQGDYRERIASESARSPALPESRIIGGQRAAIEEYPFAVSLQNNGTFFGHEVEHFCGGGIVGEKWIITSAQCALRFLSKRFHVRAGTSSYYKDGDLYTVESITIHPAFNQINYDFDIGIVKLSESIVFDNTRRAAALPKEHVDIQDGTVVQVLGWGASQLFGPVSNQLLRHQMRKIDNSACEEINVGDIITSRMFCALSDTASLCVGDSGTPLVYNGVLFGVASWSRSCAYNNPTTYTAISQLTDWITDVTGIV